MALGESCRADESGGNDRTNNSRSRWLRLPPAPHGRQRPVRRHRLTRSCPPNHCDPDRHGSPRCSATPDGRIRLFSEQLEQRGHGIPDGGRAWRHVHRALDVDGRVAVTRQIGVADEAGRDARREQLALPSHRRADFERRRPVKQASDLVASPRRADEKLVRRRSIAGMQQQGLFRRHPDTGQLSSRPARSGASAAAHIRRSPGRDCDVYHGARRVGVARDRRKRSPAFDGA